MIGPQLVLATTNPGKLGEWRDLLEPLGIAIDVPDALPDVPEDTGSVAGNALQKARAAASALGGTCLADDVGLAIEALDGRPGPELKHWAMDLGGWKAAQRRCGELAGSRAIYRCGLAVVGPSEAIEVLGEVPGVLVAPRGPGVGVENCFLADGASDVLSRLEGDERSRFHHRERALRLLLEQAGSQAP